jgi:stalled ribosome rescue protein Dom34
MSITMTAKKLGIWMDHDQAHLTEFTTDPMKTTTVLSRIGHEQESVGKGEHHMHTKEQHIQGEYYKTLGERIFHYKEVVVFGPTSAKDELVNYLSDHHLFRTVKIRTQPADKMTDNQLHAFVKKYFSEH